MTTASTPLSAVVVADPEVGRAIGSWLVCDAPMTAEGQSLPQRPVLAGCSPEHSSGRSSELLVLIPAVLPNLAHAALPMLVPAAQAILRPELQ